MCKFLSKKVFSHWGLHNRRRAFFNGMEKLRQDDEHPVLLVENYLYIEDGRREDGKRFFGTLPENSSEAYVHTNLSYDAFYEAVLDHASLLGAQDFEMVGNIIILEVPKDMTPQKFCDSFRSYVSDRFSYSIRSYEEALCILAKEREDIAEYPEFEQSDYGFDVTMHLDS